MNEYEKKKKKTTKNKTVKKKSINRERQTSLKSQAHATKARL